MHNVHSPAVGGQSETCHTGPRARLRHLGAAVLALVVLAFGACSPAAIAPAAPTASPAPANANGADWDAIVAAAKKEGTVSVIGPTGDDRQNALTVPFTQAYGIQVDYLPDPGASISPKVSAERQAGQYNYDVYVGGTTTMLQALVPIGALDPIQPDLITPEVTNGANWRNGAPEIIGPHGEVLVMTPFHRGTLFLNTNMVDPTQFHSYTDLLDPQWSGKILSDDPRKAGPGQATFTFFYLQPDLGTDFILALAKQNLTLMNDYEQEVDALAQGQYPILIGTSDALVEARMKKGITSMTIVDPRQLKESSDISAASGDLSVFNHPPHPNAMKVYVNWLLSQAGQTAFSQGTGYVSSRVDVATDFALPWRIPEPGAINTYDQNAMDVKPKLDPILKQAFG